MVYETSHCQPRRVSDRWALRSFLTVEVHTASDVDVEADGAQIDSDVDIDGV